MPANAFPLSQSQVPLDHVIFHAGQALDALASVFARLGFQLTPLGRHSSGSVNRLAILGRTYLELVGFEPGTPPTVRPEIHSLPLGLTGLAVRDDPAYARATPLERFLPSRRLERPVDMPGVRGVAAFTNTEVREPAPDVRVFLCRHHTPGLVWHPAWQDHPNTAAEVTQLTLRTRDAPRLHEVLRTVLDVQDPGAQAWDAAGTLVRIAAPDEPASLTVRVRSLAATLHALAGGGIAHRHEDGRVTVALPAEHATRIVFAALD